MIHPALFFGFSTFIVAGALGVVLSRKPMYAALSLVISLCALSGLFIALGAYFLAIIQILLYAGAILILFLFVLMLMETPENAALSIRGWAIKLGGTGFALIFLIQTVRAAGQFSDQPAMAGNLVGSTQAVGRALVTTYALPFEAASFLLLIGIIGAVVLAKKDGER